MKKNISGSIQDSIIYVIFFFILAFALGGILFSSTISSGILMIAGVRENFIAYIPIEMRFIFYGIILAIFAAIGKSFLK